LIVPRGWALLLPAVLAYALHHGLAKGALFLAVAVPQPQGASRGLRTAALAGTAALGLSLAGMTLTSGAAAKSMLKQAIAGSAWPSAGAVAVALSLAAVGTTLLMARVIWLLGSRGTAARDAAAAAGRRDDRPPVGAWILGTAVSLAAPWTVMRAVADPVQAWSVAGLPYLLAGAALAALAAWMTRRGAWRWTPTVPAGDILVPIERASARVMAALAPRPAPHADAHGADTGTAAGISTGAAPGLPTAERALLHWRVYALLVLALVVAAAAALVLGAGGCGRLS
jgi:hypothetical protein